MVGFQDAVHRFLGDAALDRADVDRFLDPSEPKWAQFDPELGYTPHPSRVPDGVDGAVSTYRYGEYGERLTISYADQPCRISTYGDSFTQCHQVSDGETWQEQLAAHLGEPIRNFGVGGYGVYQAYRRLCRTEATPAGAEYVVFNIYLDDHYRSLDAYRLLRVGKQWWDRHRSLATSMFHANPWCHVRFDSSGTLIERANPCPDAQSLYQLCDRDFLIHTFEDDPVVQLLVAQQTGQFDFLERYRDIADAFDVVIDTSDANAGRRSAGQLYDRLAFRASLLLLARMRSELAGQGKKLLLLLSYPPEAVISACRGETRKDAEFLRQLPDLDIDYIDSLTAHVSDHEAFAISPDEYVARYYNGHYTPVGNQFFAFAIKPTVASWLQPPPPAYPAYPADLGSTQVNSGRLT